MLFSVCIILLLQIIQIILLLIVTNHIVTVGKGKTEELHSNLNRHMIQKREATIALLACIIFLFSSGY